MDKTQIILETVKKALEDKKATEIKMLHVEKITVMADYFVIASGSNRNQLQAIVDEIDAELGKQQIEPKYIEGRQSNSWILMDYGTVIIHIFDEENREFYNLDKIWSDATSVTL
ncbi:MAG: ribosome silencing factor [Lachnospiraceae bacterium]